MSYIVEDIAHFVMRAPYLELSRPPRAQSFLEYHLELLSQCYTGLDQFPRLQVEPLEFFYKTLWSLGILDRESLEIMLTQLTWRGIVWGGWLALMNPQAEFADLLANVETDLPDNLWPVQCAIARLESTPPPDELRELDALATQARDALTSATLVPLPMRQALYETDRERFESQMQAVTDAYHQDGTDSALRALRGTRLQLAVMDYPRWLDQTRLTNPPSTESQEPASRSHDEAAIHSVGVKIVRCIDDDYPGFVECELRDVNGAIHRFHLKSIDVYDDYLTTDDEYPLEGQIRCVIVERTSDLVRVNTATPDDIESVAEGYVFAVDPSQLMTG